MKFSDRPEDIQARLLGRIVIKALYVSEWDGDVQCASSCWINLETMVVSEIELAANREEADYADCLSDEYVLLPGGRVLREDDGVTFDY